MWSGTYKIKNIIFFSQSHFFCLHFIYSYSHFFPVSRSQPHFLISSHRQFQINLWICKDFAWNGPKTFFELCFNFNFILPSQYVPSLEKHRLHLIIRCFLSTAFYTNRCMHWRHSVSQRMRQPQLRFKV